ncbi:MAG: TetR/AcrR family transcriptional regulator [Actinomycetia bacterium]|nr:TetR/AcrR family transcriptional regulator [Actinomycetes bacterium]
MAVSRARVRPTREETRARLYEAAAEVFAEHGIGAATVEQITSAAGFTRGAFYSNFATKDELLLAMFEDHVQRSIRHNLALLEAHPDAVGYLEAVRDETAREGDPLHNAPMLLIELILHVARTPEHRPALAERLRTLRTVIGEITVSTLRAAGFEGALDVEEAGSLMLAIEDGFLLHRLIDPDSTPADAYLTAILRLQELALRPR